MRAVLLLRAVNVGGHNRLPMADLRAVLADLGAADVATYLQSGNAVLTAPLQGLPERVERALHDRLGLSVRVLIRTLGELDALIAANPFPERVATPKLLHVAFFAEQPDPARVAEVGTQHGADMLAVGDRAVYLSYAHSSLSVELGTALRRLGGVTTVRNWRTVCALAGLAAGRATGPGPA